LRTTTLGAALGAVVTEANSVPAPRTRLERALSLFTIVNAGEGASVLVLALNVFVLLSAYYIVKPVREALILELESGAEYKAYMSAVIAALLLVAVPLYARLADRVRKLHLVVGASLFFASHLVLFWLAAQHPALRGELGLGFYAWVGVFNIMVVAQFWAFAADYYDEERGKRLFPVVALGASLGAAFGAKIAALLIPLLGVFGMLLVASGVLGACALLFVLADRLRPPAREQPGPERRAPPTLEDRGGAFALVFAHRYLLLLAVLALLFNWVNTNGEYLLGKLVKASAQEAVRHGTLRAGEQGRFIGEFYGDFFFWVNLLGVFLQSFVVSRVVKYLGVGVGLLVLPAIALGNSLTFLFLPVLAVVRVGKLLENGTDYSLNNTVRQMLWLPTTQAMKYKAKQAVDTFFVRLGDVSSALLIYVGTTFFGFGVRGFAAVNLLLVGAWLAVAVATTRENRRFGADPSPVHPPHTRLEASG
jgi:AAA family ATP:ADP antiporter